MTGLPTPPLRDRHRRWGRTVVVLAAVAVAAAGLLVGRQLRSHTFSGAVLQPPAPAAAFDLRDQFGRDVDLAAFRGRVVLVYFGYTYCPDVCPTVLGTAARAIETMGPKGDGVQLLFVTVDPGRDTPQVLGDYLAHFDSRFLGLTGSDDQIARAASRYGIHFQANRTDEARDYAVDHSASLMIIDTEGRLRLLYPSDIGARALAADLSYLLR